MPFLLPLLIIFSLIQYPLWGQTAVLVKDINPGNGNAMSTPEGISVNGKFYFSADDGAHGVELWASDGTKEGTKMIKDIVSGTDNSSPTNFVNINGILYFNVGTESAVWRSDGTEVGTHVVSDITVPINKKFIINGVVYFTKVGISNGSNELWRSNFTVAGTYKLKDFTRAVEIIYAAKNMLYLYGAQNLWRSDGTAVGTFQLTNYQNGEFMFGVGSQNVIGELNGIIYFGAFEYDHAYELWRSDGTPQGTYLLKDIFPNNSPFEFPFDGGSMPTKFYTVNGVLYFQAMYSDFRPPSNVIYKGCIDGYSKYYKYCCLWRSDGTESGTSIVQKRVSTENVYFNTTSINGTLYFTGSDTQESYSTDNFITIDQPHGYELWMIDEVNGGAHMVKDIFPGTNSSAPLELTEINGKLYFVANDGVHGFELWKSDGTTENTLLVKDIYQGSSLSYPPKGLTNVDGTLFFYANDGVHGYELWLLKAEVTAKHYHQLTKSKSFKTRKLLAEGTKFGLCADGSEASVFTVTGEGQDFSQAVMKISDATVSQAGSFSVIKEESDKNNLVVRYKHPDYIQTGASSITLVASVYATPTSTIPLTQINITVYRAPVMMVHGLNSEAGVFSKMEDYLKQFYWNDFLLLRADYAATSRAHFSENKNVVPYGIDDLINRLIINKIAAGKVDVIGHSMGGILTRLYLQSDNYWDDLHKVITLNTPHSGSQLANYAYDPTPSILTTVKPAIIAGSYLFCNCGALEDLKVDSDAIRKDLNGTSKNKNKVPSHVITTTKASPTDLDYPVFRFAAKLTEIILTGTTLNTLFEESTHDWIVAQTSQFGGLGLASCKSFAPDQMHSSTANPVVFSNVKAALLADPDGNLFCRDGFEPKVYEYKGIFGLSGVPVASAGSATIQINSLKKGQKVQVGSSVAVTISGTGITEIKSFISYTADSIYAVRQEGSTANFTFVVDKTVGRRVIVAVGKTASGALVADSSYFYAVREGDQSVCKSLQSGDWTSPVTWSCGHEPTVSDIVIINSGHTITISTNTAQAFNLTYSGVGGRITYANASAKLLLTGGD